MRKFTHKTGFIDNVSFIEIGPGDSCILVYKDGSKQSSPRLYTIAIAEEFVFKGFWVEIGASVEEKRRWSRQQMS